MKSISLLLKTLALFLYGFVSVVVCAGLWNARPGVFLSVLAGILLAANGYVIYRKAKALAAAVKEGGIVG